MSERESLLRALSEQADQLAKDRVERNAEIQRLREALLFYAERRNLHVEWSGEVVIRDRGEFARRVLDGE